MFRTLPERLVPVLASGAVSWNLRESTPVSAAVATSRFVLPSVASSKASSGRRRFGWAQLLRRVLHVDALSCPRCTTGEKSVPLVVLACLTDPDVVGRILRHLGLPPYAPVLSPARSSGTALGFDLPAEQSVRTGEGDAGEIDAHDSASPIRPP